LNRQDLAIQVLGLSKVFHLYSRPLDLLKEIVLRRPTHWDTWALKDLSFEVKQGEMIGIIGRNGSGKSTLLKILTGVLDKTFGEVTVQGRTSAILELGTGFHPEYTGRQNIFMGGMCLGMSRQEIEAKLDWIIDFSELEEFIDQPIRTYSTGMKARLAFSTAICVEPDVLFVDEALSVGDARFQRKCFEMISQFRAKGGTIVLVSHDLNTVSTFCDRAMLLDKGCLKAYGEPREVTRTYHELLYCQKEEPISAPVNIEVNPVQREDTQEREALRKQARQRLRLAAESSEASYELRFGDRKEAEILDFGILDQEGKRVTVLTSGERYKFFLYALFHEDVEDPVFGFLIRDPKGTTLFGLDTGSLNYAIRPHKKGEVLAGTVEVTMWLTNGEYFLSAGIAGRGAVKISDFRNDGLLFSVPQHPLLHSYSLINLQPTLSHESIN
jgi:ABC-type polysaccharide/polyol phosphate transport system ATPase subunit